MSSELAPVIVFAYNRKDELQQGIEALKQCSLAGETDLFLFSDGARREEDKKEVLKVRDYIKTITGFKKITFFFSEKNKGLANSIIGGVTKIFETYSTVIVLEDDLIPSRNFLQYMNQSLQVYEYEPAVFSVSGYNYPFKIRKNEKHDVFFLPRPCSTGWATWKDRWVDLDWEIKDFQEFSQDAAAIKKFKEGGTDIFQMLKRQQAGEINSWAIRWAYNQFRKQSLTVYPLISKIRNIGFSGQASNTNIYNKYSSIFDTENKSVFKYPTTVSLDPFYHSQLLDFFSIKSRIKSKLLTYLVKYGIIKNKD
jgi:hypothetical protein